MNAVELNSVRISRVPLVVPLRFYKSSKRDPQQLSADKLADTMNAAGFSVVVDPTSDYWLAWVDPSVNLAVLLVDHAFHPSDVVTFAYLAWRVHVDDAVQAAYALGGLDAAAALLTSAWVDAQGPAPEVPQCSKPPCSF